MAKSGQEEKKEQCIGATQSLYPVRVQILQQCHKDIVLLVVQDDFMLCAFPHGSLQHSFQWVTCATKRRNRKKRSSLKKKHSTPRPVVQITYIGTSRYNGARKWAFLPPWTSRRTARGCSTVGPSRTTNCWVHHCCRSRWNETSSCHHPHSCHPLNCCPNDRWEHRVHETATCWNCRPRCCRLKSMCGKNQRWLAKLRYEQCQKGQPHIPTNTTTNTNNPHLTRLVYQCIYSGGEIAIVRRTNPQLTMVVSSPHVDTARPSNRNGMVATTGDVSNGQRGQRFNLARHPRRFVVAQAQLTVIVPTKGKHRAVPLQCQTVVVATG